jgi:hypothetical protein
MRRHDVRMRESGDDLAQVVGDAVVLFGQVDQPLRTT